MVGGDCLGDQIPAVIYKSPCHRASVRDFQHPTAKVVVGVGNYADVI